jgi:hypothetical protein
MSTTGLQRRNFTSPDHSLNLPGIDADVIEIGDYTVARVVQAPGWVWSRDMGPTIGSERCESHHIGLVVSGRWGAVMRDGTTMEFGPDDVFDVSPGHDGYTIGDEPCVLYEWSGVRSFIRPYAVFQDRVLASLMFTDLVGSTEAVAAMGDPAWRDALRPAPPRGARRTGALSRPGGDDHGRRTAGVVRRTGAGHPLRSRNPRCRARPRDAHPSRVHVGEVELAGGNVRGVAVHEAARIMAAAPADEVMVSEIVRALTEGSGIAFEDRGERVLKGLDGARRLFAYAG